MISIAVIEDNAEFRQALETIIKSENDFMLTASFDSAEKALPSIQAKPVDIVITDISLPGMRGVELIVQLKQKLPQTQFMVCTIHDDDETVFEALKCGASGYLVKEPITVEEIVKAIRDLYNGGSPMSPFIARKVISSFQKSIVTDENSLLSSREKEVLELLSKGLLYKEIAERLGVTHETVKKHLKNIYQKLHVQNKIEAINKFKLL
ncbi:MAG: response regulator transcription factor [Sphingobacteriales bacterium]|nr:response regulator transcription factor [Sphingobacteriales bacterium]MBI3717239.1 response regulator transcription factor [Sphingobacteriales bacterium]